jgi:hypothetical protein
MYGILLENIMCGKRFFVCKKKSEFLKKIKERNTLSTHGISFSFHQPFVSSAFSLFFLSASAYLYL